MVKLAWRMLFKVGDVWSSMLRAKYAVKEEDGLQLRSKSQSSQIWKGILWGADLLRRGMVWEVRNGRRIDFGRDNWLDRKPSLS